MRGRKPTPTALRVLRGNPQHRPLPTGEPRPRPLLPRCPEWLSPAAKRHWRLLTRELAHIPGLLTAVDGGALAGLCESFAAFRAATEFLNKNGPVYRHEGRLLHAPHVSIARNALAMYLKLASEYGLTAASRARIALPPGERDDDSDIDAAHRSAR